MADIKISGRKISVTDAMRARVEEKIGGALKVFDIQPMSADVVLRVDKNPSNPDRRTCEVTVYVRAFHLAYSVVFAAISQLRTLVAVLLASGLRYWVPAPFFPV